MDEEEKKIEKQVNILDWYFIIYCC